MDKALTQERGQSLVLVALMAIVLVAFTGLAVDGGNAFSQRRVAQNAADGAAVRGALLVADSRWRTQADPFIQRDALLTTINQIAERHGVKDTDGIPDNAVNGNVVAYYRDSLGALPEGCASPCAVLTTMPKPSQAWGVSVNIGHEFSTYFTGIIGWNTLKVSANAVSIARAGAENEDNNDQWALFASNENDCDAISGMGDTTYALNVDGATSDLIGNAHSNRDMRFVDANKFGDTFSELTTYITGECVGCNRFPASEVGVSDYIGLVLPDFANYYNLADAKTAAGVGNRYNGDLIFGDNAGETNLGHWGPPGTTVPSQQPYTFINGNLVITSTSTTVPIRLGGLIVVNGNVSIQAPRIDKFASTTYGFTLLATGNIRLESTNTSFNNKVYESTNWDELLRPRHNVASLWSNRDYTLGGGGDVCTTPAIEFLGRGTNIQGAILAPTARVEFRNAAANRIVNGTIIADTILATGTNNHFLYNASYFPPQPDIIELVK